MSLKENWPLDGGIEILCKYMLYGNKKDKVSVCSTKAMFCVIVILITIKCFMSVQWDITHISL